MKREFYIIMWHLQCVNPADVREKKLFSFFISLSRCPFLTYGSLLLPFSSFSTRSSYFGSRKSKLLLVIGHRLHRQDPLDNSHRGLWQDLVQHILSRDYLLLPLQAPRLHQHKLPLNKGATERERDKSIHPITHAKRERDRGGTVIDRRDRGNNQEGNGRNLGGRSIILRNYTVQIESYNKKVRFVVIILFLINFLCN